MSARLQNADARGNWERGKFTTMAVQMSIQEDERVNGVVQASSVDMSTIANKSDGKYEARDGQIVKKTTGEPIPEDEPIFILRGRDRLALLVIASYLNFALDDKCTGYHIQGIAKALTAFAKFQEEHKDRMKQPGVTLGR